MPQTVSRLGVNSALRWSLILIVSGMTGFVALSGARDNLSSGTRAALLACAVIPVAIGLTRSRPWVRWATPLLCAITALILLGFWDGPLGGG